MHPFSALRQALVSVRDAIDGHLYRRRRARALQRMGRLKPASLMFVCLGNVCRSPYAERVASRSAPRSVIIASGGFIRPGRTPPDRALEAASARGVEHSDHRSRVVNDALLAQAGAIFVFDRFNARDVRSTGRPSADRVFWLGDFDPEWTGKRAIIDPWGRSLSEFSTTFERIERCVESMLTTLSPKEERRESIETSPEETA
jgi:protein-tyrosine-phosphatase